MTFFIGSCLLDLVIRQLFEVSIPQDTILTFDSLLSSVYQRYKILENIKGSENIYLYYQ